MADCTIKKTTWVLHDRLHVFLFSSEKLEKLKHLKLVVSHLGTFFTYILNHCCLIFQLIFQLLNVSKVTPLLITVAYV